MVIMSVTQYLLNEYVLSRQVEYRHRLVPRPSPRVQNKVRSNFILRATIFDQLLLMSVNKVHKQAVPLFAP